MFFGHQMGPEQTLRRETWTDRREISVRVSFISKSHDVTTKDKGYVISGRKTNILRRRTPVWVGLAS